jgi:threonine synthase
MKLIATRPPYEEVSLRRAVLEDPAPAGTLYQPVSLPHLTLEQWRAFRGASFPELAEELARLTLGPLVGEDAVREIVSGAFDFPLPIVPLDDRTWVLELFHGPTGSFKDFGARFLARLLSVLRKPGEGPVVILVATSGDTGGAVADAVRGLEGVRAVVLFPRNRMSDVQLHQIQDPAGENRGPDEGVTPVEVLGSFDDCQRMVKDVLASPGPEVHAALTSANSVNVGRLLPQAFYYAYAWCSLPPEAQEDLVVSVPSGNLGNLTAGVLAAQMGIPFAHFIAASNANAAMGRFYETGALSEEPSLHTLSSAMDVARPSNLTRLLRMFEDEVPALRDRVTATRHEDADVMAAMRSVRAKLGYLMDPHTAVGYLGLEEVRRTRGKAPGLLLSTADPAKFPETVERATGSPPPERPDWDSLSEQARTRRERGRAATVRLRPDPDALRALLGASPST